jgi:hypothetical protein
VVAACSGATAAIVPIGTPISSASSSAHAPSSAETRNPRDDLAHLAVGILVRRPEVQPRRVREERDVLLVQRPVEAVALEQLGLRLGGISFSLMNGPPGAMRHEHERQRAR